MLKNYDIRNDDDDDEDDGEYDGTTIYDEPKNPIGFRIQNQTVPQRPNVKFIGEVDKTIQTLSNERLLILQNKKISTKEKIKLLNENKRVLILVCGGTIRKTNRIIYAILLMAGVLLVAFAILNTCESLSTEITLVFIGTVMGSVIAAISSKLGKTY